jgi:hypothetical protein
MKNQKTEDLKTERQTELKTENTALTTTQLPIVPASTNAADDVAALAAEARELSDDIRVGDALKFKKGKWSKTIGKKEIEITATMSFAIDVRSYRRGWIKWVDRKPVFKMIARPIDGFVSPVRDRLGDNDETRWPRNSKGEPTDPWQENFSVVLRDLGDGRLCTWVTTSWYGSKAIGALLNAYVRDHKNYPGLMPVTLLSSETKSTMNFSDVDAPLLTVVDWQPFGEGAAPPGMRLPLPPLPPVQELLPSSKQKSRGGMDDEIPF